ncbi:MAG: ubiquinol-cytochrome c reductase iron-sulfur subunit [Anaerolineae bacterium]|nr:ubiquinol-cytochrome c reductase iron-sulfur subunit [Anaerolineae bacterium]
MATASSARSSAVQRVREEAASQQAADVEAAVSPPSRREFLYYIWNASILMVIGQITVATLWFAFPRFAEGEFGGTFSVEPTELPAPDGSPVSRPDGRFWLSRPLVDGAPAVVALYAVCTHLGCLPKWVDVNDRFECPCHGSKFQKSGLYIEGPAPRSMDRFRTIITFTDGSIVESNAAGDPIPLAGRNIQSISVDTGSRILRAGKV